MFFRCHLASGRIVYMKIVIGSENPTKLEATKQAFAIVWPDETFTFETHDASSGVNEQPMSEEEAIEGGRNRARFVLDNTDAEYAVGMEGGMYKVASQWFVSDWAVIRHRDGREGLAGTPRYAIPDYLAKHVKPEFDLSAVLEHKLGTKDVGRLDGYAGMTTDNHTTRTTSNRDAIVIALAPFVRDFWQHS